MAKRDDKKEIDPEVLMRRKFRAKCQFRACARMVMENAYWLIEGIDHYEGVDDVKRRVEQAVHEKKKKNLLTIKDKALLNKPALERTEHEKKYLYRILGGLKCFKRYPNRVKRKLAAVTYFKYYGPGRVIVRENQEAHAMFFIVTGSIHVSHVIYDEVIEQFVSEHIGDMHAGDIFGEVSLLHNIKRTATITTSDHCEMLMLTKEDFATVLLHTVQAEWDEVKKAMLNFTYFDEFDEVDSREFCIVAQMKSYQMNETILGDGQGVANYVYFVLQGRCQMIESLQVIVTTRLGRKFYTLHDPYVPKEKSEGDLDKRYFDRYKPHRSSGLIHHSDKGQAKEEYSQEYHKEKRVSSRQVELSGILKTPRASCVTSRAASGNISFTFPIVSTSAEENKLETEEGSKRGSYSSAMKDWLPPPDQTIHTFRESTRFSDIGQKLLRPLNIRTYFMQVCQMTPGASFGFGENMRDRRIIALTPVNCMLLPKVWLQQRNTANIWTRIHYYLEKKIPNKKALFKEFLSLRRWDEYCTNVIQSCKTKATYTTRHDVPFSVRLAEAVDM